MAGIPRQCQQHHQSEQDGRRGITHKEPEESFGGQKTGGGRAERPTGIERHAVRRKGSHALVGWNQIRQQREAKQGLIKTSLARPVRAARPMIMGSVCAWESSIRIALSQYLHWKTRRAKMELFRFYRWCLRDGRPKAKRSSYRRHKRRWPARRRPMYNRDELDTTQGTARRTSRTCLGTFQKRESMRPTAGRGDSKSGWVPIFPGSF